MDNNKQPETYEEFYDYFNGVCGSVNLCENCPIQKAFIGISNITDCINKFDFEEIKAGHISIGVLKLLYDQVEEKRLNEN